jgi:tetratricopeptide (TPR) repeat protein
MALLPVLTGCNAQKKNTAATRQYTAFITRYNIYYNGDKHYKETLAEMENKYEDDYSGLLFMHPAEARQNTKAPQPSGSFTRSIEKAQKAIQLRSITKKPQKKRGKSSDPEYKAWMKRDEYNPFLHNAWLMMGRSQYMNGDFAGAASTFFYTARHFSWLPETVTEAKLWEARSYLALGWLFEAENIVTRIKADQLTNNTLTGLYNFVYGDLLVRSEEYAKAVPYLREAIKYSSSSQKTRLWFLLGQVYQRIGDKQSAYQAFKKAGGGANATYRTKFNARIKQSEVYAGNDIGPEVKALTRMTRYDRNKEYLDQIYYAIGNLYLSRGDTVKAIENYELAAAKSTRSGIDKAISQLTLGALYYDRRQYEKAQPCYAEAVPLLPENYPDIKNIKRRSDVLDELATYSQNITLQDSLLRLSAMTPDERMAVIDKIIKDLKKKEKEEADAAKREEYLANQSAQGEQLSSNTQTFNLNTDDSWYFYNSASKSAGKTEFQKRWGSRKLEDNWRRRNKATFNSGDFDNEGESSERPGSAPADSTAVADKEIDPEKAKLADDPHYPEYYLKQIPSTEEEIANSRDIIQESLYNVGVILKDKLEDYAAARAAFDRLLNEYPDNTYRLEVYYNLYLMAVKEGDKAEAEKWRQLILGDFAESKYGIALQDPNYIENLRKMDAEQEALYESAFQAYVDNDNAAVHKAYRDFAKRYPTSKMMPRFMFIDALTYVTERNPQQFNAVLKEMLERYPDTDVAPYASAWLKGMAQGREIRTSSGGNLRGMFWDIRLSNDSTAVGEVGDIGFELNDNDRQLLVMVYPTDVVPTNQLLYEIARHNFRSFVVKDFDLEPMNFGRLGMIVIKDFDNLDELNHYRRVMGSSPDFKLPAGVRPVVISVNNFDKLLKSGGSLDDYFKYLDEQNYQDAQSSLLPYESIETLREREEFDKEQQAERQQAETATEAKAPESGKDNKKATPANAEKGAKSTKSVKPETKPAPAPQEPSTRPEYHPGSEGDDPLLDM